MKRLLFLCQSLPYPPDQGARIRSFHTLRLLAEHFRVTALCFYRASDREDEGLVAEALRELARFGSVEAFPVPQEQSRWRLVGDHVSSVVSRRPYTYFTYRSRALLHRLRELRRTTRIDAVHVDTLDLSYYLDELRDLPVVCTHHNVESLLLERRAEFARSRILGRYLRTQGRLMRREEQRWCPSVRLNLTVSSHDRACLETLAPGSTVAVVPNGVDTNTFRPKEGKSSRSVVFVGSHGWFPNRDGMEYFCEEVLSQLRALIPDVAVTWVGRSPEAVRDYFHSVHGVRSTGYVGDIRPFVHAAGCFIVPLRVGGGSRLKILEAWAMGKAVVSTSVGCEGLAAEHGTNILIGDGPHEFAAAVAEVLRNDGRRRSLGEAGRRTAEESYEWERIGEKLLAAYARTGIAA